MKSLALFTLTLLAQQPDGIPFQGTYENKFGYAYRVTVPSGFTGLKTPPPAPQHGVTIDLGSGAYISVDGSYNAQFFPTARHAAAIHAESQKGARPRYRRTTLAGLPAVETIILYQQRERRSIIALRPHPPVGIVYEIVLDAPLPLSARALSTFRALRETFQLTRLPD
jgi:hypothetical protein